MASPRSCSKRWSARPLRIHAIKLTLSRLAPRIFGPCTDQCSKIVSMAGQSTINEQRLMYPNQLFIDGAFRAAASGRNSSLTNPATEQPFVEVAVADPRDITAAVESA